MEDLDRRILELLSTDGRMSYTDIGRATGLSTSAAQQRVRRLEQRGVIEGYSVKINPTAFGHLLTAFVDIAPFDASQPDDAPDRLQHLHEVVSCYSVAGSSSYLLKVQVTDPEHLEQLLADIRSAANVSTRTTLVLSVPFADRPNLHPGQKRDRT
ncbi:Lrp/AsnC family transcriptional regulator [Mariniluteicoccus flavus]